jgi:hypothetical protein
MLLPGVTAVLAVLCSNLPLSAQEVRTRAAGLADGRAAAEDGSIAPAFLLGLAGGVPIGISGAHFLSSDRDEAPAWPAIAGTGILIGATAGIHLSSNAPPGALLEPGGASVDAYTSGFREGFESRLRSRRRNALTIGGFVGVGVGVVTWHYLRRATSAY